MILTRLQVRVLEHLEHGNANLSCAIGAVERDPHSVLDALERLVKVGLAERVARDEWRITQVGRETPREEPKGKQPDVSDEQLLAVVAASRTIAEAVERLGYEGRGWIVRRLRRLGVQPGCKTLPNVGD